MGGGAKTGREFLQNSQTGGSFDSGKGSIDATGKGLKITGEPSVVNPDLDADTGTYPFVGDSSISTTGLDKMMKIGSFSISTSTANTTILDPYVALLATDHFEAIARYTTWFAADLEVKIVTTGNPYYIGCGVFGVDPFITPNHDQYRINNPRSAWVDASKPCELTLTLPMPRNRMLSVNDTNISKLVYRPVTALVNISDGTPTVSCLIYARFINPTFGGPTAFATASADYKGSISKPLAKFSNIAATFSKIPVIGGYADTASMLAKYGADAASVLGFSNPPMGNTNSLIDSNPKAGATNPSIAMSLAINPAATCPLNSSWVTPCDEMSFAYLTSRYEYRHIWSFAPTAVSGTGAAIEVSVFTDQGQSYPSITDPSPPVDVIEWLTLPWQYCRADMTYKLVIVRPQISTGRFLVWFDPASNGAERSEARTNAILWDISQSPEIEIKIPFSKDVMCMRRGEGSMGYLNVVVESPVRYPTSSVEPVRILVFRKCDNMWVAEPCFAPCYGTTKTLRAVNTATPAASTIPTLGGFYTASAPLEEVSAIVEPITQDTHQDVISDKVASIRLAVKSCQIARRCTIDTGKVCRTFALMPKWPGGGFDANVVAKTTYDDTNVWPTLLGYYKLAYQFYTGSIEWAFINGAQNTIVISNSFNCGDGSQGSSVPETSWIVAGRPFNYKVASFTTAYSRFVHNTDKINRIVPPNCSDAPEPVFGLAQYTNGADNSSIACVNAGDDFNLHYWLGTPTLYAVTRT